MSICREPFLGDYSDHLKQTHDIINANKCKQTGDMSTNMEVRTKDNSPLLTHMRFNPDGEVDLNCVSCGIKYRDLYLLKNHIIFRHLNARLLNCSICKKTFVVTKHYYDHLDEDGKCPGNQTRRAFKNFVTAEKTKPYYDIIHEENDKISKPKNTQ